MLAFSDSNCNPAFSGRSTVLLGREKLHWVETGKVLIAISPFRSLLALVFLLSGQASDVFHHGFGCGHVRFGLHHVTETSRSKLYLIPISAIVIIIIDTSSNFALATVTNYAFGDEFDSSHVCLRTCLFAPALPYGM